jgi:hypothetical protein
MQIEAIKIKSDRGQKFGQHLGYPRNCKANNNNSYYSKLSFYSTVMANKGGWHLQWSTNFEEKQMRDRCHFI